jgi:pimeloyl-ACP methyl ester carboxylesterase
MPTKTIAFIHGAFVTKHSWAPWIERYQALGYHAEALAWPLRDKPVDVLKRAHPDPSLGEVSLKDVIEHLAVAVQRLGEQPVLIGHSLGGLLTQLLLQRGLAVAGVAIDSVPPQGIIPTQLSFYKAGWPLINPFIPVSKPYYMSFAEFQYAFTNGLPLAAQRAAYDAEAVPESRRIVRQGLTSLAKVDFNKSHPPLLLIAGEKDNFIPPGINLANFRAYHSNGSGSVTELKEFPGRTHYIIGQPGWEEVADFALAWLKRHNVLVE